MRGLLVGQAEQVPIHRVGLRVIVILDRLLQRGNGVGELALLEIHETQAAVGHFQRVIFRGCELFVGELGRLGQRRRHFDGTLGI